MVILGENDFEKVWDLMKLSFIDDELRPFEKHKALLHKDIYHIYGEWDNSGNCLKAIIAIWDFKDFAFIDYFAVHPSFRNHKLGERILNQLFSMTDKNICLEIDTPKDEISFRRLNFYERNGFSL